MADNKADNRDDANTPETTQPVVSMDQLQQLHEPEPVITIVHGRVGKPGSPIQKIEEFEVEGHSIREIQRLGEQIAKYAGSVTFGRSGKKAK